MGAQLRLRLTCPSSSGHAVFLRSSVAEITRLAIGGEWVSRNPIGGV